MTASERPVALVTGASRGIGAAAAHRLARDGMAVAVNSHPRGQMVALAEGVAESITGLGGQAQVYPADITSPEEVEDMFARCERDLGRVSVLVLNASMVARGCWQEIPVDQWDAMLAVSLRGAFLCARHAFGRHAGTGGRIVVVSSVLARTGAPGSLHYGTAKAGLVGFTRSLARELGKRAVRVNCVMPGAIVTEEEIESFPDREEADREAISRQCLQRRGVPDDVAAVVSFLAGPDSDFVTGQTLVVDGGWVMG